jgi:hypothetical protein
MTLTVALVGAIVFAGAVAANADVNDSWITTQAKIPRGWRRIASAWPT